MPKMVSQGTTGNRLLNLLPTGEYQYLHPVLQKVAVAVNQVLYEPQGVISQLYFPISCVLSAVTLMSDGHVIEVGTAGNEGVTGLRALSIASTSPHRVFALIGGDAWQVESRAFARYLRELPKLNEIMTNYQQAYIFHLSQSVACNGLHAIEQRCCRWLLMTHDRIQGDDINLTHGFLSFMLGVRRAGVTQVLQLLQKQGHVRCGKGCITILNRVGLEELSCECYGDVQAQYKYLLSD